MKLILTWPQKLDQGRNMKLKDADIIYTLQWIASKEDIQINKDALKLIASKSDGSLRDAEMTFEQLSLLGQKVFVPLVQEMDLLNTLRNYKAAQDVITSNVWKLWWFL